jgi:hypothetical protein
VPKGKQMMEETGVLGENHRSVASRWQTLSHNVISSIRHNITEIILIKVSNLILQKCIGMGAN